MFVNTDWLNVRSTPEVNTINRLVIIPLGQQVNVEKIVGKWARVNFIMGSEKIYGYCALRFLSNFNPLLTLEGETASQISEVHRRIDHKKSFPKNRGYWSYPLGDPKRPHRNEKSKESKIKSIYEILDYLDVENSARYTPKKYTYCNIYAHDYAYLCNTYIPRVWWSEKSIIRLSSRNGVVPHYGSTIYEKNANSLYYWFENFGEDFGWGKVHSIERLQEMANKGYVAIIVARNRKSNNSGHISCVIPEYRGNVAKKEGELFLPLMSQAGRKNYRLFNSRWWTKSTFSLFSFWTHK